MERDYSASTSWYASAALARVSSLLFSDVPAQATSIKTANKDRTSFLNSIGIPFFLKYKKNLLAQSKQV